MAGSSGQQYQTSDGRRLKLGKLLKSGGAGSVHRLPELPGSVAKIYHAHSELSVYQYKVEAMLRLRPILPEPANTRAGHVQMAWPTALLRDARGAFAGFLMPELDIKATSDLEHILQAKQARAAGLPEGLGAKVTLAANLCAVIAALHDEGHYVVDLKPVNLRFYRDTLQIALLDCDGLSINGGSERFPASQFTPDYLAPEFHGKVIDDEQRQDRFALAVVVFQLLNSGIHPYSGKPRGNHVPTDLPGRIQAGAYAYGVQAHRDIAPNPASGHAQFPDALREMFDRAFGRHPELRPSAAQWRDVLQDYALRANGKLSVCKRDAAHQHFSGMDCAACKRAELLREVSARQKQAPVRKANPAPVLRAHRVRLPNWGVRGAAATPAPAALGMRPLPSAFPAHKPLYPPAYITLSPPAAAALPAQEPGMRAFLAVVAPLFFAWMATWLLSSRLFHALERGTFIGLLLACALSWLLTCAVTIATRMIRDANAQLSTATPSTYAMPMLVTTLTGIGIGWLVWASPSLLHLPAFILTPNTTHDTAPEIGIGWFRWLLLLLCARPFIALMKVGTRMLDMAWMIAAGAALLLCFLYMQPPYLPHLALVRGGSDPASEPISNVPSRASGTANASIAGSEAVAHVVPAVDVAALPSASTPSLPARIDPHSRDMHPATLPPGVNRSVAWVKLELDVSPTAVLEGARILRSSGDARIDARAIRAVRQWQYEPPTHLGKKVAGTIEVTLEMRQAGPDAITAPGADDMHDPGPAIEALVRSGALRKSSASEWQTAVICAQGASEARGMPHDPVFEAYVANGPVHLPEGLYGGKRILLIVPADVPMPTGFPGHSDIVDVQRCRNWTQR